MRTTRLGILVTVLYMLTCSSYAADEKFVTPTNIDLARKIDDISREVKRNAEDAAILRRDEINYRLEKELLKETYETALQNNAQTIAIASSVIAFVFAVFAFFGYKNIGKLKEELLAELEKLRSLKSSLEVEIDVLRKKQEKADTEIVKLNKTQGTKIELLEIVEKASSLVQSRQYDWAIEHIKAGLDIDPDYMHLLSLYGICEVKRKNYALAIDMYRKIIKTSQLSAGDIFNYAELLLIAKNVKDYDDFYTKNKKAIDEDRNGNLTHFFSVLRAIAQDDIASLKMQLKSFAEKCGPGASPKLGTWQFDDINANIADMPSGDLKTFAEYGRNYFAGALDTETLLKALNE